MTDIAQRKADHIDLAVSGDVAFKQTTTLFECVRLVHDALPDLDLDEIDLSTEILGKRLSAPILIAGMTGGTSRAREINRQLAAIAEQRGYAFGLGSQRAMLRDPAHQATYEVRDVAPSALLLGNIGVVQARELGAEQVGELARRVGADAICVHLNPAMEVVQEEGDRDFRDGLATLERLVAEAGVPIIAKETGCGLSDSVARRLNGVGVRHVDVSGAGGTSWVAVETQRAQSAKRALGETFWEWGIPTAVSVAWSARAGFDTVFATGGVKSGLDIAKAIALGATAGGIARPVLQALESGGAEGALRFLDLVERELRTAFLLVGAKDVEALRRAPRVLLGDLRAWLEQGS
ncbi:MAG: type 2 isopentenyl-diphosphate Delta-isomerase [Polyangiaceae bacterium]|nr:type 2 isopentenyl-diphosphate Delta-isomerase [Myxococcales bacterium]MCB9588860.1 type 2 isopentenyl-diphosphate Delta-isomerase [Polyangiaceae bacterium]MCB9605419.1 type 2 isopentenyl-diphosphate Delta-isomerase [Polyangiaceae bacterium]